MKKKTARKNWCFYIRLEYYNYFFGDYTKKGSKNPSIYNFTQLNLTVYNQQL
jgi:hypothetical protein